MKQLFTRRSTVIMLGMLLAVSGNALADGAKFFEPGCRISIVTVWDIYLVEFRINYWHFSHSFLLGIKQEIPSLWIVAFHGSPSR